MLLTILVSIVAVIVWPAWCGFTRRLAAWVKKHRFAATSTYFPAQVPGCRQRAWISRCPAGRRQALLSLGVQPFLP